MLILSATLNLFLRSLDISHAFMHSPLEDQIVLLRLPLSVSLCDGSVAFLKLKRALNGLRDASLAWLRLLAGTIQGQGLWSDTLEPCFYQGKVLDSKGNEVGIAMLLVYVDDILLATSCERTESVICDAISKVVPTKTTGRILPSHLGGGQLSFIGRTLFRNPEESAIYILVRPSYLDSTFKEFGISKGSDAAPNIAEHLEKTVSDKDAKKPLSTRDTSDFAEL